jgi:biotin carboxyl carrier protein
MPIEVKIKERTAKVSILNQTGSLYHVKIDDREYHFDTTKVEEGVYSILHQGHSINMEMIEGDKPNQYVVNTRYNQYTVDVIDARTRYQLEGKGEMFAGENIISSPMPGKIVKILVQKGDKIQKGDTAIVVSAMKMESEYKSPVNGTIAHIYVSEEDTVDSNQPLIEIEPEVE